MCNFCVKHGDGKRWYANAVNYAMDLESDLERRGYMVEFMKSFEKYRKTINVGLRALRYAPVPLQDGIKKKMTDSFEENHFGQPVPLEDCARIFDIATNITRLPCVCRGAKQKGSNAESCCIMVTVKPHDGILAEGFSDYEGGPDAEGFEKLTKEQAMAYLRATEDRGLCHTIWTFKTPFIAAICNCDLPSGCLAMRLQMEGGVRIMWKGEDVARVDPSLCTNCQKCVKNCPFNAISVTGRQVCLDRLSCWGCGTCRSACPKDAISLEPRGDTSDVAIVW